MANLLAVGGDAADKHVWSVRNVQEYNSAIVNLLSWRLQATWS
jgi:hypothetical protein